MRKSESIEWFIQIVEESDIKNKELILNSLSASKISKVSSFSDTPNFAMYYFESTEESCVLVERPKPDHSVLVRWESGDLYFDIVKDGRVTGVEIQYYVTGNELEESIRIGDFIEENNKLIEQKRKEAFKNILPVPCKGCGSSFVGGYYGCAEIKDKIRREDIGVGAELLPINLTYVFLVRLYHALEDTEVGNEVKSKLEAEKDKLRVISIPRFRGEITIRSLLQSDELSIQKAVEWGESVWNAYSDFHIEVQKYVKQA